jgi:hypothetical protein
MKAYSINALEQTFLHAKEMIVTWIQQTPDILDPRSKERKPRNSLTYSQMSCIEV